MDDSEIINLYWKRSENLALTRLAKQRAAKRSAGQADISLSELEECIPDAAAAPEQLADNETITQTLNLFLAALPPLHRRVFVRRYWYMSSMSEIAGDYGLSVSNTKTILSRARKRLRKTLEKEGISL